MSIFQDPVGLSNELSCETGSLSHRHNPHVFTARGFEALFPHVGILGCAVCLTPQLCLPIYAHRNVGPPSPPAAAPPGILSTLAVHLAAPTGLDECFFINSLVVGLSYSLIFWQIWLFLFLNLFSLFWLCKEANYIYLRLHLGTKCPVCHFKMARLPF